MAALWFYHLERSTLEAVLPDLLSKTLAKGWRALVRVGQIERLEALDSHLWTYADDSFLPHGSEGRGDAADQPILLTGGPANTNGAQVLFLVDGAAFPELDNGSLETFERIILLFDGRDQHAVTAARTTWKSAKDAGAACTYWQQDAGGKWDKKA